MVRKAKWLSWLAAGAAVCVLSTSAFAGTGTVSSLQILDGTHINTAHDNSFEYVTDSSGNVLSAGSQLQQGDILRGGVVMTSLNTAGLLDQWTAVFEVKIASISQILDSNGNAVQINGVDQYAITFGENTTDFGSWLGGLGAAPPNGGALPAGTVVRMWQNDNFTVDDQTTLAANAPNTLTADQYIGQATTGTHYWDIGFDPNLSPNSTTLNKWVAQGGNVLPDYTSGATFGASNFALSLLNNNIGPAVKPHVVGSAADLSLFNLGAGTYYADFTGSVTVQGPNQYDQYWDANSAPFNLSDSTTLYYLAVPLPSAVWGGLLLLLGMGAFRWRRSRIPVQS